MGEHGMGTTWAFTEKRKDGTLRHRVRVGVTVNGKRVWRTAKDAKDAERIRRELIEARELDLDPTRQTLAGFLDGWMRNLREQRRKRPQSAIRERTLKGYERLVEARIKPELGKVTLGSLTRRRVQAWVDGQDGSAGTVRNANAVLRVALETAVGDLIQINPAAHVRLPERVPYRQSPMTVDEVRRLLESTEGDWLHPLWRLAVATGLREGELLGLPRDALVGNTLTVDRQLVRVNGRWGFTATKAARAVERINLGPRTVAVLEEHKRKMTDARKPSWKWFGLLFVTPRGQPYHESTVLAEFRAACERAGIKPRRFHDLRSTSNRLMKDQGIDKETRKARLGHATDEMTAWYGGASDVQDREAAEWLDEAIG